MGQGDGVEWSLAVGLFQLSVRSEWEYLMK